MTIKQFIECAIEGGWKYKGKHQEIYLCEDQPKEGEGDTRIGLRSNTYAIMLDPNAWRAVGKVKGWKKYTWTSWKGWNEHCLKHETDDDSYSPPFDNEYSQRHVTYEFNMHRMIDALCDGKTIEEFIATL